MRPLGVLFDPLIKSPAKGFYKVKGSEIFMESWEKMSWKHIFELSLSHSLSL